MAGPYGDPRADALRAAFHSRFAAAELPVPVESIAADYLGLDVCEAPLPVSGLILPAERRIWLNESEPEHRRRFTLAHEVGHWVCQCLEGRGAEVMCRDIDLDPAADRTLEREANIFAANLLMPREAVEPLWLRHQAVAPVADAFGVSDEAMQWRLFGFGLVAEKPAPWRGSVEA